MKLYLMTIQLKATEQYFKVALVKGISNFSLVQETILCHHSDESKRTVLSVGAFKKHFQFSSDSLIPSV